MLVRFRCAPAACLCTIFVVTIADRIATVLHCIRCTAFVQVPTIGLNEFSQALGRLRWESIVAEEHPVSIGDKSATEVRCQRNMLVLLASLRSFDDQSTTQMLGNTETTPQASVERGRLCGRSISLFRTSVRLAVLTCCPATCCGICHSVATDASRSFDARFPLITVWHWCSFRYCSTFVARWRHDGIF